MLKDRGLYQNISNERIAGGERGWYRLCTKETIVAKHSAESTRDLKMCYKIPLHGWIYPKKEKIEGHGWIIYNREQAGVSGPNGGCWK
jgi:hypothetical protein